jgi:RimJ/RimL family protein N-acetyltransferase
VASTERGSGLGRASLHAVVETAAAAAGIVEIELNSWAFNHDAHAAFRRCGVTAKATRFELKRPQ